MRPRPRRSTPRNVHQGGRSGRLPRRRPLSPRRLSPRPLSLQWRRLPPTAAGDDAIATDYAAESYRIVGERDEVCTVLKNGLTIIAKRVASPVTSVQACVHTGSLYENRWLGGGLSHLLEHLVAGGSCDRRTEAENRNLLQQIGDNSNAYTTYDTTTFFVNTTSDHADDAVDLVTGWVFGAKIPTDEYRREYEVVQRELEKDLGEADRVFGELQQPEPLQRSPGAAADRRVPESHSGPSPR